MRCLALVGWALACWLVMGRTARADDVTTLSGTTLRQVRLVRVEPDGVTWEHATGVAKVDFTDLPEAVRREYHYDAGKAAAFQAAQARDRAQTEARTQQAQREADARRTQRFQPSSSPPSQAASGVTSTFVYRRQRVDETAVQSTGEGIAAKAQAEAFRTKDDGTVWDRRLWAGPKLLFGSNPFDGVAFDPKTDFGSHEFQSGLHHSAVSDVKDSANDAFFQPDYMTKSYNEDVDRAAAFARGRP